MRGFVKICGVTRPEDAEIVAAAGVDAIGINFWPRSKRFVDDDRAHAVAAAIPPGVLRVGVFVNAHPLVVAENVAELRLDRIQLHGDEKAGAWEELDRAWLIRAVRVEDKASLKEAYEWKAALYLYDSYSPSYGGSGRRAPWELLVAEYAMLRRPFLIAGGLDPDNVAEAIRLLRPDGVDVASGVESAMGIKDPGKVRAFVTAARAAFDDVTEVEVRTEPDTPGTVPR